MLDQCESWLIWMNYLDEEYITRRAIRFVIGTKPGIITDEARITEDGELRLVDGDPIIGQPRVVDNG